MGSLRDTAFADSPSMVLPPPNIHSFYASAHSHCIPHYQATEPSTHSSSRPKTLVNPSKKRSHESLEDESAISQAKVPKTSPELPGSDIKTLGHAAEVAGGIVRGQAEETVDRDVEMSGSDATNMGLSNVQAASGDSLAQGLSLPKNHGLGDPFEEALSLPKEDESGHALV